MENKIRRQSKSSILDLKHLKIHILKGSQLEHDKILKDLLYIYGNEDPRVKVIVDERNKLTDQINQLLKQK